MSLLEPTRMQRIFEAGKVYSIITEYKFDPLQRPLIEIDVDATIDGPTWVKVSVAYIRCDVSGDQVDIGGFIHDGEKIDYSTMRFFYNLRRNGYRLAE